MMKQFRDGDKKVEIGTKKAVWTLTKSERKSLDNKALKEELPDLFERYSKTTEVYTLKTADIAE